MNRELRTAQLSDDGQSYTPRMPRATSASEVSTTPSTGSGNVKYFEFDKVGMSLIVLTDQLISRRRLKLYE